MRDMTRREESSFLPPLSSPARYNKSIMKDVDV
jgi:hypothetical protein